VVVGVQVVKPFEDLLQDHLQHGLLHDSVLFHNRAQRPCRNSTNLSQRKQGPPAVTTSNSPTSIHVLQRQRNPLVIHKPANQFDNILVFGLGESSQFLQGFGEVNVNAKVANCNANGTFNI